MNILEQLSLCDYKKNIENTTNKNKAVFFDRDGTLHVDKVETTLQKGLELFPDTIRTLKEIQRRGYLIIVVTNQSGISKKHINWQQMHDFNEALRQSLSDGGCDIDAIYYCPHMKSNHCICAKPNIGMFERAKIEFDIDMKQSYMVGDRINDILAAKNAGIPEDHRCMVTTGIYKNNDYHTENDLDILNPILCDKLSDILEIIH